MTERGYYCAYCGICLPEPKDDECRSVHCDFRPRADDSDRATGMRITSDE
jgi:hypothetical protein